jgi:hypothetical protein
MRRLRPSAAQEGSMATTGSRVIDGVLHFGDGALEEEQARR